MFAHLHNHSQYSLLDGQSRVDRMVQRAAELGQKAIALTDHGVLYGAIEFYLAARSVGVKPIIGVEAYVAPGKRTERDPNDRFPFHLTLLACNKIGYQNLLKLVSRAQLEGFYYKPRMDRELIEAHSDGLIALSGCPSGEIPRLLVQGRSDDVRSTTNWYREVFDDRFYLELMQHEGVADLPVINKGLTQLAGETEIPLVATNDTHYTFQDEHNLHDILLCIQTNTTINDPKRLKFDSNSYYLKSEDEMSALWPEIPEALANTQRIADSCDLDIDLGHMRLPKFQTPDGIDSFEYLRGLAQRGANKRYAVISGDVTDRLHYELEVIEKTGFADYCLIAWDISKYARGNSILMGVRGSAAASLVLYCLEVTDIDPLETSLVFERFLTIERREMPDIDFDFQDDRRGEIIRWIAERYGENHVAQIVTFGTLGAKAAVRDVGRALGIEYAEVDRVARLIPSRLNMTLEQALEESHELSRLNDTVPHYKRLISAARALEGTVRHASTHAAAVVISEDPLTDLVPLQRPSSGDQNAIPSTQYSMEPIARLGLLKLDILGLTNLTILDRALKLIQLRQGKQIKLADIPFNDPKVYEILGCGETFGVFQLESEGMRRNVSELKPTSLGDISAMIALYRPGPMEHIPTFIDAKHGRRESKYPHPDLKAILEETYGVIVYQDQVLHIARAFGGYTLGEADILRKAMGKKNPSVMAAEREKFINGGVNRGYTRDLSQHMFELIEPFAGYAFNKAHSASYAVIAYWTAYLKANYQLEYMVALLDAATDNPDRLAIAVRETRRLGIPVLAPNVNRGSVRFAAEETGDGRGAIRFGLSAIKNVGASAVQPIVDAREEGGVFKSVDDLCRRVQFSGFNRRMLESLIRVGALDDLAARSALLDSSDRILALIQREKRLRDTGQSTMFDLLGDEVPTPRPGLSIDSEDDVTEREKALWERELLGVELTESVFTKAMQANSDNYVVFANEIRVDMTGNPVSLLGQIRSIRKLSTRSAEEFLAVTLGLLDGEIEVIVWPDRLQETDALWIEGKFVTISGTVRDRDGRLSVIVDTVDEYVLPRSAKDGLVISNPANEASEPALDPQINTSVSVKPERLTEKDVKLNYQPDQKLGLSDVSITNSSAEFTVKNTSRIDDTAASEKGLILRLRETGEQLKDRYKLEDLVKTLLDYRGDESVTLEVETEGKVVRLSMPFVTVQPSPELTTRLLEMLGADGIRTKL